MTRPFRFGVVAPLRTDLPTWRDRVRRIADSGYSTLLMPDVPQWQPVPAPTLAVAAMEWILTTGTDEGRTRAVGQIDAILAEDALASQTSAF